MQETELPCAVLIAENEALSKHYEHALRQHGINVLSVRTRDEKRGALTAQQGCMALLIAAEQSEALGPMLDCAARVRPDLPAIAIPHAEPDRERIARTIQMLDGLALGNPKRALVSRMSALVGATLEDVETALTEATIASCGGSIPKAAQTLGVSPSTIYRRQTALKKRARPGD